MPVLRTFPRRNSVAAEHRVALPWFGVADQSNPSSSVEPRSVGIALHVSALSRKPDTGSAGECVARTRL